MGPFLPRSVLLRGGGEAGEASFRPGGLRTLRKGGECVRSRQALPEVLATLHQEQMRGQSPPAEGALLSG